MDSAVTIHCCENNEVCQGAELMTFKISAVFLLIIALTFCVIPELGKNR